MGKIMHKLISPQQVDYVKGRCIQDRILLASEMINEMKKKRRCGNSAKTSVMVNGGPCGFFSVGRGLGQGDPISPILFVLMKEALSRRLTQLVNEGLISPLVERKGIHPTHLFFADDVFIFCKGAKKSILNLMKLLDEYQICSGQIINKNKRKMFIDGTSELRKDQIKDMIQMERSELPEKYLGVILIAGRVKVSTVWPMVELIIPVYNMDVYKWPTSVINICERIIRNFLWSSDWDTRKYLKFSWKKMCTPFSEGDLGIPKLEVVNMAFLMKMMWKIDNSKEDWALFFQAKYKDKNGQWSTRGQLSSVWPADNIHLKVSDMLLDGVWSRTTDLQQIIQPLRLTGILGSEDVLIWTGNLKGEFSIPEAVNKLRHKEQYVNWSMYTWKPFLHPPIASNVWKLI
ncbi:uncharacterized protein LOC113291343 [Papaver somniferum]|uniref:uncharacterized protein LOC113291343 n=1 Tax=Papaver somniferum TaxID=3469 RepID=UPI000E6F6E46|nr:uncharacterized protein LOC113291343 [Papaver somniferum]